MRLLRNLKNTNHELIHILLEEDKIFQVYKNDEIIPKIYDEEKDYTGKYVMSGIIDPHVHMRDPGLTYKEDFETGSKACAKGGITTFFDMPNTIPNVSTYENLKEKRERLKGKAYVNYGFYFGGIKTDNSLEIQKIKKIEGKVFLKIFLNASTGDMLVEDEKVLKNLFSSSDQVFVHAEGNMTKKALEISYKACNSLYVCHVATKEELSYIIDARKKSKNIYAEVTPHHLFLTIDDRNKNEKNKMLYNMKPKLKTKEDQNALWEAIDNGIIDTIGTDHAPHTYEEKLEKITFGVPGVETSLPLMLTAYKKGKISLSKIEKLMSENPAKIMGLKNKGKIEKGFDGDLTIIEFADYILDKSDIVSKCGWSPFEGYIFSGKAYETIVNGKTIYCNNKFINDKIGKEV